MRSDGIRPLSVFANLLMQCASPDSVLKKARQCSSMATRQSIDVNVSNELDEGNS